MSRRAPSPRTGPAATRVTLERVSTAEALIRALTRQILDGSIRPGTWLREVELAERHGVSRQSLRTALVELVHQGLLQREPHRGVWVPVLTADDLRDLYRVRTLIEVEAARVVAARPQAWPALAHVMRDLERLPRDASPSEIVEGDFEFHRALVAGVGSERLSRSHEMLCSETRLSFVVSAGLEGPGIIVEMHRELLAVLKSGDADAAMTHVETHMREGLEVALERLATHPVADDGDVA